MNPVALIALAVLLVYFFRKVLKLLEDHFRMRTLANRLPGPKGVPILGNLVDTFSLDLFDFTNWILGEAEKIRASGETMMMYNLAGATLCVPLDGITAKNLLDSNEELEKGLGYDFFHAWLGDGLFLSLGQKWHSRRKMLTPTFHFQRVNVYFQTFNVQSKILTSILGKFDSEVFDVLPLIKHCALDIICETAMGRSVNAQYNPGHPYVSAVKDYRNLTALAALDPLNNFAPYWYLRGHAKIYKEALKELLSFTTNIINERHELRVRGIRSNGTWTNFLDLLFDLKDSGNLTLEDIREEVDTFMFGGHDTTSTGIAWAMWCLAHHLDVQERLREEIDDVVGGNDEVTLDHLREMRYLNAVLREVFRLYPPVPDFKRKINKDLMCGKYLVPKGASIEICLLLLHRNKQIWGEDADKFNPERFVDEDLSKRHAFDYIPFSAGPRNCIGGLKEDHLLCKAHCVTYTLVKYFRSKIRPICGKSHTHLASSLIQNHIGCPHGRQYFRNGDDSRADARHPHQIGAHSKDID